MAAKPLAIALAVAAAFSSPAVVAQTSQDNALSPIVVTASRTPQSAKDVLSDNIVITAEEIARSGHTSLTDLLQQKRGIELTRTGGIGNTASVFIRGAENRQSIVLIDGVRIGSSTAGGATWETIPLSQVDHVEIVYGPLSSLYGADAMGGVIQIFTKQGDGAPRANVSAGAGSFGTRNVQAGVAGATSGDMKLRYAIQAAHEEADGFSASKPGPGAFAFNPDKDGYKRDSVSGQLGFDLAKGHELGFTFLQSRLNAQFDAGPGYDDRTVQKLENVALYSKNKFLPAWTSHLQLSQSADKSSTDAAAYGKSDIDTRQTNISWQNDIAFGTDVLQLVLERREEKVDTTLTGLAGKRTTNSAAASYQLKQGNHLASVAIRNDNSSQFGTHATGSIDYGYRITTALRANASIGTSFRAPTFNELYYPGFGIASNKPEKGKNAEAGLYYDAGDAQLSVVYYRNRITDLLVYMPVCPVETATHPFGCQYNVDQALLTGVSLGASTRLGRFTVRGSLDVQDPRDETTDQRLTRRARQHGSIGIEYGAHAVNAGAELVFSGARYDDFANLNRLGGYGVLNLHASYDFAPNWSVFGRWNNVTDKNYELARNFATPGSNLFVGVRYGMK